MSGTKEDLKTIYVNNKKVFVKEDVLLGKEILERADYDPDKYDLYLILGQKQEKIENNQQLEIKNDMRFNAIIKDTPYG